jgi:hypothetical protein
MRNSLAYKVSLGLSVVLTVLAFVFLLGSFGRMISGWGEQPWFALFPWLPLALLALTAANCSFRARLIVLRGWLS